MIKQLTCIVCPIGCELQVDTELQAVTGNTCKRGAVYGIEEVTRPTRVITSTVKLRNSSEFTRLPVKTKSPIPKELNFRCMEIINALEVEAPIKVGQIIMKNLLDTGVDLVATRSIGE